MKRIPTTDLKPGMFTARPVRTAAGQIILDISGEEKKKLTKEDLLARFAAVAGQQEETDSVLLS